VLPVVKTDVIQYVELLRQRKEKKRLSQLFRLLAIILRQKSLVVAGCNTLQP